MKLGARLRFSDEALVEGGETVERRARDELRKEQRIRIATQSPFTSGTRTAGS